MTAASAPDPVLVRFATVVAGLLATGLVAVLIASWRLRARQPELARELALRYRSWVVIAGLVVGALALGRTAWIGLVGILAWRAFEEYARAVGLGREMPVRAMAGVLIGAVHLSAWGAGAAAPWAPGAERLFLSMPLVSVMALLAVPVVADRFEGMARTTAAGLLGVLVCGWLLGHLACLVNVPEGTGLVLLVLVLTSVHDVAAFTAGRLAGRHPLRPALSPRKTWEGAAGALLVVSALAQALGWLVPGWSRLALGGLGVLVAVGATGGDLALAMIKRDHGIKDWGAAVPGHGGLLDRLNSLVLTAPLALHYARLAAAA